ncbi:type II toxin-antitoxin system death-on-curing family toxin [Campylobacter sp. MIT 12-8780]|uniref:type II toxin-antitoxin system death-on-curing family toxin n=1 Tax=unclassified Campylobacter TaxID=2593542 RepID=UPI00115F3640|nr:MULTISPECIES: Fic family protein [unclassified Campylobacter]NDJ26381.1 type II toxin-antitoxin system death-on-curing family toxin [Campylobacter sp. MIT 19-121]TQR42958.1 type II toxin-antitoxin system death-on-curing family toxin [Campylobacter sp. MIT 12-8780]
MNYIRLDEAIAIHDKIIEKIGGLGGYNEQQIVYLASALEHIKNDEYYPSIADKITHLMFSCIQFHPFLDANKRTSIFLAMHFLDLEGIYSDEFAELMENVVVNVASGLTSKDELNQVIQQFITEKSHK